MANILVVEDSPTQALAIRFQLEAAGFTVEMASQGKEALAGPAKALSDVVLTDLDMPEMNGLELVEAIRRDYPAVPVILMTAQGSEEIAVEALQKGAASYIPKRNMAQHIVDTLDRVISVSHAGRDQLRVIDSLDHIDLALSWTTTRPSQPISSAFWRNKQPASSRTTATK